MGPLEDMLAVDLVVQTAAPVKGFIVLAAVELVVLVEVVTFVALTAVVVFVVLEAGLTVLLVALLVVGVEAWVELDL